MTTGSFENVTGMLVPKRVPYIQHIVNKFIMNRYHVRVGGVKLALRIKHTVDLLFPASNPFISPR
jgi:hypothetical protein